jgi:hypothetical protein
MAIFYTRIELHDAEWSDYETLHEQMANQGFTQTITADSGMVYQLPPAEYRIDVDVNKSDILERAKLAAKTTKKKHGIFIIKSAGTLFTGLESI